VFVTPCEFDQLMGWNQSRPEGEGSHLDYSDFKNLVETCNDREFRATACQIQAWYMWIFESNTGTDVESLGPSSVEQFKLSGNTRYGLLAIISPIES
jgi:hypothetical protein